MKQISEILTLPRITRTKITSERSLLIEEMTVAINKEREGTKWKKLAGRAVALKTAHLKLQDLYYLHSICKQSRSGYGKCFFGSLKVQKK